MAKTTFLTTGKNEYIKTFIEYDALSRMEYIYEAHADARDGAPCLVTQYAYDGTSQRVVKTKEYHGTWLAAYEI
jgi:hypothetical protein